MTAQLSRRGFLGATTAALVGAQLPTGGRAATTMPGNDVDRYVRLVGDAAGGWTFVYTRGQIYGHQPGEVVQPLMEYEAGLVNRYTRVGDGHYRLKRLEVMQFLEYGADEALESWRNPWTGEDLTPLPAITGPLHYDISLDHGLRIVADYESSDGGEPFRPAWRELGDRFEYTVETMREYPNSMDRPEFGDASNGPVRQYCDFLTWIASTKDMYDPKIDNVPATTFYSGQTNWTPWMFMGRRPGALLWHSTGGKYSRVEDLPASYVSRAESLAPGILTDSENFESDSNYVESLLELARARRSRL